MWKTWHSVLCFLLVPVLAGVAWYSQDSGFETLQQMRQLERTPRGQIISVIRGEVNLKGEAVAIGEILRAPHTSKPCLYYLYILEEEREDSDGDSYWAEIRRETQHVSRFKLRDGSGDIDVVPSRGVDFSVVDEVHTSGDYRHTEYRLEPGDAVFVFGHAVKERGGHFVEFATPGLYTPIISTFGERGERSDMAAISLWLSYGALVASSFAVMFLCWGLKVHRLLVFLSIVSLLQGVGLTFLGLNMMRADLETSRERALRQRENAREEIQLLLQRGGVEWDGDWADGKVFNEVYLALRLTDLDISRVQGIYGDVAAGITRFNTVCARFPERHLAPMWGVAPVPGMALADSFAPGFGAQREIEKVAIGFWHFISMLVMGVVLAIFISRYGFRKIREKRYIENIPTSFSTGLSYGPSEIKGTARKEKETFKGPLSGRDCIYYHYVVREKRGSGKNAKWVTIVDREERARFLCEDAEGTTPVDLEGAEIHSQHHHSKSSGNRHYTEVNLRPGDEMYLLGPAIVDPSTGDRLMFALDDSTFPFIAANLTEGRLMTRKGRRGLGWLNVGLNGFVLAALGIFGGTASYAPTDYMMAAFIAPVFLALCFVILMYNDLQFVRHRVRRAWANIDVSLKKRADLIPNLELVVKQYLKHESGLQKAVANLRSQFDSQADWKPDAADKLLAAETAVTQRVLAVQEAYPDLKGNQVVQKLFDQIITLENEVALMRQGYNDSVERHNTRIGRLPELLLARFFKYKEEQLLHADVTVRAIPKVELPATEPAKNKTSKKPSNES